MHAQLPARSRPRSITRLGPIATGILAAATLLPIGTLPAAAQDAPSVFDSSLVHSISVTFDEADYDALIAAYQASGDKAWIEATAVIDGVTYEDVGMRLKGNSSLMSLRGRGGFPGGGDTTTTETDGTPAAAPSGAPGIPSGDTAATEPSASTAPAASDQPDVSGAQPVDGQGGFGRGGGFGPGGNVSADEPEGLPWLIRLDKNVDGQALPGGITDIVVRSNNSETSLNEAVSLELLSAAGLASQAAAPTSFSVNGSDARLRLIIENPDDAWQSAHFEGDGALYKAESTGDWTYRGDDPEAYTDIFDQEAGKDVTDLAPLIDLLQWLDEADDATFAAELPQKLDVDAFATYLAMMDILANFDDIDGPGNNAYLHWDAATGRFTIVPWDMNLALSGFGGGRMGPGGDGGGRGPMVRPQASGAPDANAQNPGGGFPGGGRMNRTNPLVEGFHAVPELEALYQAKLTELRETLVTSGAAQSIIDRWAGVLTAGATDLVDAATIEQEAAAVAERLAGG